MLEGPYTMQDLKGRITEIKDRISGIMVRL